MWFLRRYRLSTAGRPTREVQLYVSSLRAVIRLMDFPELSPSTRVAAVGFLGLGVGAYLPWMTGAGGTLEQIAPWEVPGLHPARAFLLAPLAVVFVLCASGRLPRTRLLVLAGAGAASVVAPPLRILQAVHVSGAYFVPSLGFFVTTLSGLVLAAAATLAWTERRRDEAAGPSEP